MIRRNLFWKLFALAVAMGLWSYVNAERNPRSSREFAIALQARNLPRGYVAEFVDAREVTVAVEGPKELVDRISKEDVTAWVALRNRGAGEDNSEETARVRARVSGVAQDELSMTITPRNVRVRTEAIRWKRLPVEVKFLSPPPLGYSYSEPQIDRSSIAVSGRTSLVSKVTKIIIPLPAQRTAEPIDEDFKVLPVDSKGNVVNDVDLDETSVHVKMRFVEAPATKVVIVSPNVVGQPKFPAVVSRVSVAPPTITLQGSPAALMDLSTVSTEPIQIDGVQASVTKEVGLRTPGSARILGRRSVRVSVSVSQPQ